MIIGSRIHHWKAKRDPDGSDGRKWFESISLDETYLHGHLDGKCGALVGNARSLLQTRHGRQIDENDLVIRMNHAPSLGTIAAGSRFDWLATSIRPVHDDVEVVLWVGGNLKRMPYSLAISKKLYVYPSVQRSQLAKLLGSRASTGAMVISLLLNSPAHCITLFGFDFFKSLSLSGNHTIEKSPHDMLSEARWVEGQMTRDERLTLVPLS